MNVTINVSDELYQRAAEVAAAEKISIEVLFAAGDGEGARRRARRLRLPLTNLALWGGKRISPNPHAPNVDHLSVEAPPPQATDSKSRTPKLAWFRAFLEPPK
jgi:hypothetical protein